MKTFKLIRSHPATAVYNMELDNLIFDQYLQDKVPVLRIYSWQKPSFTYGLSQNPEDEIDLRRCLDDDIGIAKRITGGGILFHDNEITYSFACDKLDVGEPSEVFVSYREICTFLINFYKELKLPACFALESKDFMNRRAPSNLCSASCEKYDIVINGKKIGGNAQKRRRSAIFQHGSIPLSFDWNIINRYIKQSPKDLPSHVTALSDELINCPKKILLEDMLINAFARTFNVNFIEEDELAYEASLAR